MLSIRVSPKLLSTRVIYQGQSEAALLYLPGGLSEAALSTVTVLRSGANLGP